MKSFIITLLISLFLISSVHAGEFGIGGSWPIKGHSDDTSYGVNNGDKDSYAITAYYDIETILRYRSLGIDPGFSYTLLRWWKDNHNDEEVVDSHIFCFHLRPFLRINNKLRVFALGGIGYEEAINDGNDNFVALYGIGIQQYFNKNVSMSYSYQKIYNNPTGRYRRYGMDFVATLNFRF